MLLWHYHTEKIKKDLNHYINIFVFVYNIDN